MKFRRSRSVLQLALLAGLATGLLPGAACGLPELLVPAYFDPTGSPGSGYWDSLVTAAGSAPVTAIMNPNSGPGLSADPAYSTAIGRVHTAGGKVVGYVATGYATSATRTAAAIKADIDSYLAFYVVDGFFLDEMSSDAGKIGFYSDLYSYIQNKSASAGRSLRVIGNPGTDTAEGYLSTPAADVLMIYEDKAANYAGDATPAWVSHYSADHFAMVVHTESTAAAMHGDLGLAAQRNTGLLYVTDDSDGVLGNANPYDTLPSYWSDEVASVAATQTPGGASSSGSSAADSGGGGGGALTGLAPLLLLLRLRQRSRPAWRCRR